MNDSLLLYNGIFFRFDGEESYQWLWIQKGVIQDAGFDRGYEAYVNQAGEALDLKGNLVLPGFCDCRVHFIQTALKNAEIDLNGARSYEEVGWRIHRWLDKHPRSGLVRAYGLEVSDLREKTLPDRKVIDNIVRDYPVWISSRDYHRSMLNTRALHYLNVPLAVEGVELDENQLPTGILRGTVNALIRSRIFRSYSDEEKNRAVEALSQRIIRRGVTSVHAMEGGYGFAESDAQFLNTCGEGLPIDISLYYGTMDIYKVKNMRLPRIGGEIFIDGSFASSNAALFENYSDSDGRGELNYSQEEINAFLVECYRSKIQTALHAVGGRAIEQVLRAHQYAQDVTGIRGLRHRVEHAELSTGEQRKQAAQLQLIFSMQPACEYFYGGSGGMYESRLGQRSERTNQLRQVIDSGIVICGGSDSDLTPINPIGGIHAAVNHPQAESAISIEEAVRMFTLNGAYATGEEHKKGSIELGKMADLAVLDQDIFQMNPRDIMSTQVVATIKHGAILYNNL